jgi:hypothetical protein
VQAVALTLVALYVCSSCSVLFSSGEGDRLDAPSDATPPTDAITRPQARIRVLPPPCGENIHTISGEDSTPLEGDVLTEFRWVVTQANEELANFAGFPTVPIPPSTHVLDGTHARYSLRPSLLSAPHMLSVIVTAADGTNQVYQRNLTIQDNHQYDLSFVASSALESRFTVKLIQDDLPFASLGLSQEFAITARPVLFRTSFTSTAPESNARLQIVFDTTGSFSIDNLRLDDATQNNLLQNGDITKDIAPWIASFPGGGEASLQDVPTAFLDTRLQLVVVDSSERESFPEEITITASECP